MTRFIIYLAIGFVLVGCSGYVDENTSISEENNVVSAQNNNNNTQSSEQNVLKAPAEYLAENEVALSIQDSETAYEMCVRALADYYKAIWNGSDIELERFIENKNLKLYTQKKIESQYGVNAHLNDPVKDIEIGTSEVEFTDDADGGFLYLKLPVEIKKTVGSYGEVTEFLVRNSNGKLVIIDWYTGTKDSFDFTERGENLTIDNPNFWIK